MCIYVYTHTPTYLLPHSLRTCMCVYAHIHARNVSAYVHAYLRSHLLRWKGRSYALSHVVLTERAAGRTDSFDAHVSLNPAAPASSSSSPGSSWSSHGAEWNLVSMEEGPGGAGACVWGSGQPCQGVYTVTLLSLNSSHTCLAHGTW